MNPTFPLTWYAIAALLVTNAFSFGMWRYDANQLDQLAAIKSVEDAQYAKTIEQQKQITEDTTNGWKAALDSVRQYNARRVLPKPTEAGGVSYPASSVDATNADAIPSPARVAEDCSYTTLTANQLQDWVQKQQQITK